MATTRLAPEAAADPPPSVLASDAIHHARILIIDDEEANVRLLERILTHANYENFITVTDAREVVAVFEDFQPDLVLTDWLMPHLDGLAVLRQLNTLMASDDYLPILVLTADVTERTKQRALTAGATDFLTKPFDQTEVLLRIRNLLRARLAHLRIQEQNAALEASVRERTHELERTLVELRATQQQVIQQERLAALGTMAGGIAHDFNNSLCAILGFTELLIRDSEHGLTQAAAAAPLATILTAAEDAAKIVQRLREFHRRDEINPVRSPVHLNTLVEQAVTLAQPKWQTQASEAGAEIQVSVEPGEIPAVAGDATELREALANLIFNAVDAMPRGGVITLRTRVEGNDVLLEVRDTGVGMSEEVRRRCLEPFFTTKGPHGTGLGLAMVFGILQRHSGTVEIESVPNCGTTLTLRLPAMDAVGAAGSSVTEALSRPRAQKIECCGE